MKALSELQSYLLYYGSILFASIFAGIAQKAKYIRKGKYVINPFFWIVSFMCLLIPAAFRGLGVDHVNYLSAYRTISGYGWNYFKAYKGFPEPLYAVINVIAGYLGDFQYVYIISAFISLFFTYKAFARKVDEINLAMCVWMFSTLFYLNLFGLVRMCIAVGIITYAYRYIEEGNFIKYTLYVTISTLFHYSAIIMLPLYFIYKSNYLNIIREKSLKKSCLSLGILILIFCISNYVINMFGGRFSWLERYAGYFEGSSIAVINNSAGQYPLIILMLVFGRCINQKERYGTLYLNMLITMIIFLFGSIFVSFMRLTYYFYPATYYLYSYITKYINDSRMRILYKYAIFIVMSLWFLYRFTSDLWGPFLVPYYFNLP